MSIFDDEPDYTDKVKQLRLVCRPEEMECPEMSRPRRTRMKKDDSKAINAVLHQALVYTWQAGECILLVDLLVFAKDVAPEAGIERDEVVHRVGQILKEMRREGQFLLSYKPKGADGIIGYCTVKHEKVLDQPLIKEHARKRGFVAGGFRHEADFIETGKNQSEF